MYKLLIIDDNHSFLEIMKYKLENKDFHVICANNGNEGISILKNEQFDLILTDMKMAGANGLTVIKEAKKLNPTAETILITAYATVDTAVEAIKNGAYDYITKKTDFEKILLTINRALEKKTLTDRLNLFEKELQKKYKYEGIIGVSQKMQDILKSMIKICKTDSSVLVTGKTGTGKELVGKAIHYNSNRRDQPLIIINCGSIPESLQESELFGYVKGAFTGANREKKGLIESAQNGTIIFDEVGDLSKAAQVKLLRFLQNKEIRKVGDTKIQIVNVRVISMTNKDIKEEAAKGNFREDLYYRLNVIPIHIPSLSERREDIPLLINHFIKILSEKIHKPGLSISRRAQKILENYSWPGNIRELENLLERSAIFCENDEVKLEDLPREIYSNGSVDLAKSINLHLPLREVEKQCILIAMSKASGNKSKASRILQISRQTLTTRLQRLNL